MEITAVLVTRGDVPDNIARITDRLYYDAVISDLILWDNSVRQDLGVYGRYAAIAEAESPVVFVQDDDCLLTVDAIHALIDAYEPGKIVANMPAGRWSDYPDSCLVGWGAVFDRELPEDAFTKWDVAPLLANESAKGLPNDFFERTCDVVFTTLTPHAKVDLGFTHLPGAEDPARAMFLQPGHGEERARMLELARKVRDA